MRLYMVLGFLGSGKTTFVKHFLPTLRGEKAVIVNDFGSQDVDGRILENYCERLEKIYDGSLFCSCRSDRFAAAVISLSAQPIDNIVVEASGLANPALMYSALNGVAAKCAQPVEFSGAFCLVDIPQFERQLSVCHAVRIQAAMSDKILLNKADLVSSESINRVSNLVRELNPTAKIEVCRNGLPESFEVNVTSKPEVMNIEDLTAQKCTLRLSFGVDPQRVEKLCAVLSTFSHRIKGALLDGERSRVFEYADGVFRLMEESPATESFAVILACTRKNLKSLVESTVSDCDFVEDIS